MAFSIAAIGASLSLFLLLVLCVKRPVRAPDAWLAAWLATQFLFCSGVLLAGLGPQPLELPFLLAAQLTLFGLGPAQYLYAATAFGADRRMVWHLATIAWGACGLGILAWLARPDARGGGIVLDHGAPWLLAVPVSAVVVASFHPLAVLRLVARRREQLRNRVSAMDGCDPGWLAVWAWAALALLASVLVVHIVSLIRPWSTGVQTSVALALQVGSIAFVGHRGLTQSGIFIAAPAAALPPSANKITDPAQAREDYARVTEFLAAEKPYLEIGLTAQMLSDRLGWAPERLTAAFRQGGSNFFDTINAARVDEVKRRINDSERAEHSLLTLAFDAGFGSKTAFYDAFGRYAGCTPSAWRREQLL